MIEIDLYSEKPFPTLSGIYMLQECETTNGCRQGKFWLPNWDGDDVFRFVYTKIIEFPDIFILGICVTNAVVFNSPIKPEALHPITQVGRNSIRQQVWLQIQKQDKELKKIPTKLRGDTSTWNPEGELPVIQEPFTDNGEEARNNYYHLEKFLLPIKEVKRMAKDFNTVLGFNNLYTLIYMPVEEPLIKINNKKNNLLRAVDKILKAAEKLYDTVMSPMRNDSLVKMKHSFIRAWNILSTLVFKAHFIRNEIDLVQEIMPHLDGQLQKVSNYSDSILKLHLNKTLPMIRELLEKAKENIEDIRFKVKIDTYHKKEKEIPETFEHRELKILGEIGICLTEIQGDTIKCRLFHTDTDYPLMIPLKESDKINKNHCYVMTGFWKKTPAYTVNLNDLRGLLKSPVYIWNPDIRIINCLKYEELYKYDNLVEVVEAMYRTTKFQKVDRNITGYVISKGLSHAPEDKKFQIKSLLQEKNIKDEDLNTLGVILTLEQNTNNLKLATRVVVPTIGYSHEHVVGKIYEETKQMDQGLYKENPLKTYSSRITNSMLLSKRKSILWNQQSLEEINIDARKKDEVQKLSDNKKKKIKKNEEKPTTIKRGRDIGPTGQK